MTPGHARLKNVLNRDVSGALNVGSRRATDGGWYLPNRNFAAADRRHFHHVRFNGLCDSALRRRGSLGGLRRRSRLRSDGRRRLLRFDLLA